MSCFYRGTCSCSQVYTPYCSALANDCQFCGIHSMGACCAIWNGHALFGNSCCAKRLRRSTESTLFKKKSFSKRVAEEEAKDALKNKKKKKRRKNSQDLEIMFKALENFCDPKKCEGCDNDCGKCGHQDGRKVAQKISATSIKSYGSKISYGSKKPEENQKETNKEKTKADTNKYSSKRESKDKSGTLANSTKPGKYENPITTKANETKEASRGSENEETTKAAPSGTREPEETKANTEERKQFNEIEICNILTDLLVKKFKAMDYTNNTLGSPKKDTPNTSPCCSKCICEVCSCLETSPDDSTDFSEVESKIGTAVGALISENLSKSRNVAQRTSAERENDSKKLKTPKETLPIGKSPMAAINPRRVKERAEQRMLVNASTSMSDSKDDVMAMPLKKVSNSSAIDRLISELNQIEEEQAKCCKSHSKGYWSEIDEDLSEPDSKKKKKLKGSKKSRTKDARGSFGSKRSSIESKVHKKSRASSDKASPAKQKYLNKNTCTSKESPARKLGKPMIEILKYANKLNVGRNSRSSWAESPDRDAKETIAQDLTIRKYNRASQTVSLGESLQEGYDSRSPSRGSILTSQIDEHYSHNVRPPPSTKTRTSDKIPELRASVSSAAQRQSKTADKRQSFTSPDGRKPTSPDNRQSVTSPDSRKPTTFPDSRKPTTSRDSRKPTTSPDNRQSDTSPDNRKSITSDKMESPDRRASIRFPDTTSFDNRQSTSAPVLNSRSSRQYQGCNKDSCTSKECPAKNRSSRAVSSRIEPVQEGYDSRSPSRGSTSSSEIQEHASRNAQHPRSSKTKYPTIFSNNKIPSTKSFDKKPSISAPDIRASVSNAPKNQSKTSDERPSVTYSDNRQPTTSPHKRLSKTSDKIENGGKSTSAPDGRKPTKSPDNRQSDTSPDIRKSITSDKRESPDRRPSIRLPDKKQSILSDKNQSTTSSDNRQSTTAPILNSRSSRQYQGCNKDSCTSKECPAKNRSSRAVSSRIEPVQEGYDSRSPSRGSTSSSEIREHASHNAQHPRSSKIKYPTIFSTNKIPSTKYFDKKPSISAPDIRASVSNAAKNQSKTSDERPSVTYSDNRQPNTSPDKRLSKTSDKRENGGKSTSAPDGRKPTTSSDNRQSDTSPDIRKSITSDQRKSPDRRPSIRLPDKKQNISSDKNQSTTSSDNRQSTTAPVLNSRSSRQYQGCNKDSCTSKECPAKNRSSRAESSRIEPVQEGYDSRSPSRGSTSSSEIQEHASHNAQHPRSSKTKYPTIFSNNKIPSTKSFDKKPSISAPDIRASVSNAAKKQSETSDEIVTYSENRQRNTSPYKRLSKTSDKRENGRKSISPPDGRESTTSPDNRQSDTSPDIRKSITSDKRESSDRRSSTRFPDKKQNISSDKNQYATSSDNRQSTTPVLNSKSSRQYQDCNKNSCTSKECPVKNRSSLAGSSRIEPVQEAYDSRRPSRGSTSLSEIQEHESHNAQDPSSTKTKEPSISAPDIRASVSNAAKKQSKTSDERPSVTYPDNRQPNTSPDKRLSKTSDNRENGVKSPSAPDGRKSTTSPDNRQSDTSPDIRKSITSNKYPTIFSTNKIPSTKSSDKRPSISAPDIRASVSNVAKNQSKTSDKRPSVASSDGRKPTTSSDNRQPNTSPDKRLSNTSDKRENGRKSDNRQSVTSPDSRKSITSDKRESLNRSPSIRLPDKNQAISSDKRQSTTSAEKRQNDGCSNSCTPKENDAQKFNKPLRAESPDKVPKKSTPEDLPIRKCARASQTEPTIEQFQIDHSAIPRKKENAPIIACCGSETGFSDNMPTVRPPEKSDKKPTRRSSDKKPTVRSPYITPSVRSTDKKLAVRSSDKKTSTRSSTKNQTSTSPDKRNSNKSANKRRSSSPSDEVSRQREYSRIKTCTSKECLMKKSAQVKSSHKETTPKDLTIRKSARSAQTESLDKSVQKDHKSKRTSTASSYLSPVETNSSPGHIMRLTDNKTTVRSPEKKRDSDNKPSRSSPVERRSSTSPENTYSSSSPTTLSSSPRLEMDLIVHTNASSAKKCDCQCRALSRSKNRAEELKESAEDDASYENHSTEISLQKRTVESQTVSPNESPLTDTDSSNASRTSKTANDCSISAEDARAPIFSGNKLCQCDTDETDESSMKPLKPANFNENNPPAASRQSKDKTMRKSWSEKDVSLRAEETRIASLSANERCVCDFKRTDDTSMPSPLRNPNCACSRLQTEEDPMEAPVFPTNNHAYRTKGNRCACKDERKSGSIFMEGASRNSTRRSSDRSQIENKSEAYSSRKETPSTAHGSPMENEDDTYNCQNNAGCQCIYKAPNSREISSKPNLFAFINTKTDDPNTTDANAKNLEAETQSAAPSNCCNFSAQRGERRAECHQAWAAFRKLQECFSDFDLEGECFKKLENYAEFRSDIFGSSCRCDQTLKSNSDEKTRNSKAKVPSSPEEKENVKPDFKNKQNNTKKRSQ